MSLKDVQKQVDDWVKEHGGGVYWQPFGMLARVTEEVGELARGIHHEYGLKKKKSTEETKRLKRKLLISYSQ